MALFDPTKRTGGAAKRQKQLAPRRFTTLDGVRLGLVSNSKLNADKVLLALGDLLAERYALKSVVHEHKQNFSLPAPDEVVSRVCAQADVVIAGVGD
jgi:hypothetical protein